MRTMVAVLALRRVSLLYLCRSKQARRVGRKKGETYKNPNERIKITDNFVLGFILSLHTKKTGRIPKTQSVTADIATCA